MRYKLLKDIKDAKAWTIFKQTKWPGYWFELVEWKSIWYILDLVRCIWLDNKEWFEEIKEVRNPKYQIWEYVVFECENYNEYLKISHIRTYAVDRISYGNYNEENLRKPTEEELTTYFR